MVIPNIFTSWKLSLPIRSVETWPVNTTIGTESINALAIPVTALVAPGPDVTNATPGRPVTLAYPSAA
ncbi:hypothetical protein D3C81_1637460 [compost metagenome]